MHLPVMLQGHSAEDGGLEPPRVLSQLVFETSTATISPIFLKCPERDSNPQLSPFEDETSANWVTGTDNLIFTKCESGSGVHNLTVDMKQLSSALSGVRTPDTRIKSPQLYQLS